MSKSLRTFINVFYIDMGKEMPYPPIQGFKAILDFLSQTDPKAKTARPEDFVDMRFIKELDETGFIKRLF